MITKDKSVIFTGNYTETNRLYNATQISTRLRRESLHCIWRSTSR